MMKKFEDMIPVLWGAPEVYYDPETNKYYAVMEINNRKVYFESYKGKMK